MNVLKIVALIFLLILIMLVIFFISAFLSLLVDYEKYKKMIEKEKENEGTN